MLDAPLSAQKLTSHFVFSTKRLQLQIAGWPLSTPGAWGVQGLH